MKLQQARSWEERAVRQSRLFQTTFGGAALCDPHGPVCTRSDFGGHSTSWNLWTLGLALRFCRLAKPALLPSELISASGFLERVCRSASVMAQWLVVPQAATRGQQTAAQISSCSGSHLALQSLGRNRCDAEGLLPTTGLELFVPSDECQEISDENIHREKHLGIKRTLRTCFAA